jgi:hypothetical protein
MMRSTSPAAVGLAYAAMVMRDDLETAGEDGDLVLPVGGEAAQAADEENRKAGAVPLHVKMAVARRESRHRAL